MLSEVIFKRGSDGKLRDWQYEVEEDRWRTIAGLVDGKRVTSAWRVAKPKNLGKRNATTGSEQALAEAQAKLDKQLQREYRRTVEELESVPLGPMLAEKFEDALERGMFSDPGKEWAFQYKLDGIRALISRHGAFTRDFQPHRNTGHIREALEPIFDQHPDLVFDGELYNHKLKDDFNEISSLVRKVDLSPEQRRKVETLVEFHCYDLAGGVSGVTAHDVARMPFRDRSVILDRLSEFKEWGGPLVRVPTFFGDRDAMDLHEAECADLGYEGQMVRDPDSPYEYDSRVFGLLKRKEWLTGEFPIIRVEEGVGNWAGFAKKVRVDFNGVEAGAGCRGNRKFLREILESWESWDLSKAQVTMRYFKHLTPDGVPRFATIVDWHPEGRKD